MNTKQLIDEAVSLPVEACVLVLDSLLRPEQELDRQWAAVAQRRLAEIKNGSVVAVPGQEVFDKIRHRFEK